MGQIKHIDFSLILQSIPGLFLSLLGLSVCGRILDREQKEAYAQRYPLILLSNCILSFKGNIELIFAMYLSSTSQKRDLTFRNYIGYAVENASVVLCQSIVIGVSVGLLGVARNVAGNTKIDDLFLRLISMCLVASFLSSFLIVLLLIPSVIIAANIGINPDNIVLPIISSIGDYIDIMCLINSIKLFEVATRSICILSICLLLFILPILAIISLQSKQRIPIQSTYILVITYVLSTISGYLIQYFSTRHLVLASSYPIFCGLTGSCSFIYLSHKVTSLQNFTLFNRKKSFVSILITSVLIAGLIVFMMPYLGIEFKNTFNFLFIIGFFFTVAILLKLIDILMKFFIDDIAMAGVAGLPLVTSIADFVGCIMVLSICFIVKNT